MSGNFKKLRFALFAATLTMSANGFAQTVIKGNVTDNTGEPIIGASVIEDGSASNGGVTDLDGNFTITLKGNSKKLKVSYVGMKPQVVNVSGKSVVNIKLEDDATTLNDVVVIGYGSVKKKDLTGSVATVNNKALEAVPVANATEALQGKMAGVQITATEGSPDAEMKIRVRGGGSITGDNTPLYIVDGFPVESISDIPASEIEDITVLKDASSTAIYGSRGANGVILVTTKSGKEGKVNVSYNAYYSWKKMAKTLNTLSGSDYVKWQREYALLRDNEDKYTNLFGNWEDRDLYKNAAENDWQDQVFGRVGNTFNHNLSITGGSEKTKFNFGYAHVNDKAIMLGSSYRRDNLSLKLNHKVNKKVSVDFSMRYSNTLVNGAGANESKTEVSTADSRMKNVMIYPMFNFADLSDGYDPDLQLTNPITSVYDTDRKQSRQNFNMNGSFTWEIIKDLKFKSEFGLDWYYNTDKKYYGTSTYNARTNSVDSKGTHPMAYFIDTQRKTVRNTNTLNYDFKNIIKNKDHSLNILLGEETINKKSNVNEDRLNLFPTTFTAAQAWAMSSQGTPYFVNKYNNADDNLLSFFGRANYNFMDKYLLSATFRADGSSKFSEGNRWGYFPSAAVAWRISSEPFMKKTTNWLDDLKLRFSYGTAGNNNIPADQTSPIWSSSNSTWLNQFNSFWTSGLASGQSGTFASNPDLTWETTITRNVGLDFTLFKSKLTGSIETYWNTTKDLLIAFPVSGSGYDYQYRNLGETENKGVEISLTWNAINKKDYALSISGNIGFNKNKVKTLGSLDQYKASSNWASTQIQDDYIVKPGRAVGEIYGYKVAGRYEVSDFEGYDEVKKKWILKEGVSDDSKVIGASYLRPGALKLQNMNEGEGEKQDFVVDDNDRVKIGDTNPVATGGFNISGRLYGFDLNANFTYSIGNDVYNANKIEYTSASQYYYRNMLDIMADGKRWTNLNADGTLCNDPEQLAAMNANTTMWSPYTNYVLTDWAIEDGSFLRLATITLGYTLPQTLTKRVGINSLRFYATAYNVFCITGYSGFDPEVSSRNKTALTPGVDYSAYPKSRQFVIGFNLNF
ncbi:SusC/RagA family TonB-linked outer membrane protein [Segatella hominis]|uniref:SusC/RagA family TonB-linked outer membrane protein n=1 Tax=Segatella hominis TaxID=2518605 RepID=UPI003AB9489D